MKQSSKLLIPVLLCAAPVFAQPFATMDARSMAMGDIGVASSKAGTAGIFNPALLSGKATEDAFHLVLPNIGLSVFADPDAMDATQDLIDNDYLDHITNGLDALEDASTDEGFRKGRDQFAYGAEGFSDSLSAMSEKPARINVGIFTALSIPTETLGVSIFVNANATVETAPLVADCDMQLLSDYTNLIADMDQELDFVHLLNDTAGCANAPVVSGDIFDPDNIEFNLDVETDLESRILLVGVTTTEIGVALSHKFDFFGGLAIGITPKLVQVTSYADAPTISDFENDWDSDDLTDTKTEEDSFNIDLGFAASFLAGDMLTVGLTIKNLIPETYQTHFSRPDGTPVEDARLKSFNIDTQARVGIAVDLPLGFTLAADLDLTENKPYFLGDNTQFLGFGAEWDLWIMQLRGGMRTNLANNDDKVLTAGVGFNIILVYIDIAAQFSENNAGGALQFGMAF